MKQSHLLRGLWFIGEFSEIDYNKLVQDHATNAPHHAFSPNIPTGAVLRAPMPALTYRLQVWTELYPIGNNHGVRGMYLASSPFILTGHASCSLISALNM